MSGPRGQTPWQDIPNEYGEAGDIIDDDDALAHAFSLDYLEPEPDFMNGEELFYEESELDPLEELLADEDEEWTDE